MPATLSPRLETLVRIARAAAVVVMRHYEAGCDAREKSDRSPVTDADEEAERLILAELAKEFPGVPVVAEEEAAAGRISQVGSRFFLVDPVDGTKEFVKRGGEFTVNIGEIVAGEPVSGVVLAPAIGRLFVGAAGEGAYELAHGTVRDIACRAPAGDGLVAAGEADIYPRAGQTMEWDTAAGHAVLRAAGGKVTNWDGTPFRYGKPDFRNGPFIARGK